MFLKYLLLRCLTLLFALVLLQHLNAQTTYTDSINAELDRNSADEELHVYLLTQLLRGYFEQDLPRAKKLADEALRRAKQAESSFAKAIAYASLVHLSVQEDNLGQAYAYRDSSLLFADRSDKALARGIAHFRAGWLDLIVDESERAMPKLLEALDYLNQTNDLDYKVLINHYLASIYSYGVDPVKQLKYAEASLSEALESGGSDLLNTAYLTVAQSFFDRYKADERNKALLDSSLFYNKAALRLYDENPGKIVIKSNTSAIALNTANIYFQYFSDAYRDSSIRYIDKAITIGQSTGSQEVILNAYGMLSEYALRDQDYAKAETILLNGLAETANYVIQIPITKSRIYLALSKISESQGKYQSALNYLKEHETFRQKAFDEDKVNMIQRVEAQFESEKKEQEINYLQQEAAFAKKKNSLYIILGLTGLLTLLLLLLLYNYRLKASIRKQELIDQERQKAELNAQLKEAEAIRLEAEQALMRERQERLEKEVLAGNLLVEEKNELLKMLPDRIGERKSRSADEELKRIVKQQEQLDRTYEERKNDFFESNLAFIERLQSRAGHTLTRLDLKYCGYILIGLSVKEISVRLNVEPKSIRMARYRIKQKLSLEKDDQLDQFIQSQG